MKKIVILLAAYNGDKYIAEQIESIRNQTVTDWTLLIRDDGSTDSTCEILEHFSFIDSRIRILTDAIGGTGSSVGNFNILAKQASKEGYEYIFFSDQDDVWINNKLEVQLSSFNERAFPYSTVPCLSYSNLEVVDEELNTIAPSFMSYQGLRNENINPLNTLLVQNYITGCSMAVNKALLEISFPFPEDIIMHDWWMAQCVAGTGQIIYIENVLVKYRQHAENVVGARRYWTLVNPFVRPLNEKWSSGQVALLRTVHQSEILSDRYVERFGKDFDEHTCKSIRAYSQLLNLNSFKRIYVLIKYGIRRQNTIMNFAFMLRVFFTSKIS